MTEQQLLAVLRLPPCDQDMWVHDHLPAYRDGDCSLADVAFRLRDEAKKKNEGAWLLSCWDIVEGELNLTIQYGHGQEAEAEILRKGPIHWIVAALNSEHIAALIAKEKK